MVTFITFFGDKKKALIVCLIMGIITLCFLLSALGLWLSDLYKIDNYTRVMSVVTNYNTSDGKNVWTEFSYEFEQQLYVVRLKGHSFWMTENAEIEILCNPANPEQIEIIKNIGIVSKISLFPAGIFGVFFVMYLINFLKVRKNFKLIK